MVKIGMDPVMFHAALYYNNPIEVNVVEEDKENFYSGLQNGAGLLRNGATLFLSFLL